MTKLITPVHSGNDDSPLTNAFGVAVTHQVVQTTYRVFIRDILKDDSLQVRKNVQTATVRRYAEAMRTGAEFPPVTLGSIGGSLYLVDGWHRVAAAQLNDHSIISATIATMTRSEAEWLAAEANIRHGLSLKSKEYRQVFRAFIRSGQHRLKGRRLMAYRDIAKRLGKCFSTIRNWMKADFPEEFALYQRMPENVPERSEADPEKAAIEQALREAQEAVQLTRNLGRTLDPSSLGQLIKSLQSVLNELVTKPYEPVIVIETTDF